MVWSLCGPDVLTMSNRHIQRAEELSKQYDELTRNEFSALFASEVSLPYIDKKLRTLQSEYAKAVGDLKAEYATDREINEHFRNNPEDR
jgi:hypothetical protein